MATLTFLAVAVFLGISFVFSYTLQTYSSKQSSTFNHIHKMSIGDDAPDKNMLIVYDNLAKETLIKYESFVQSQNDANAQYWIGIAGPPGSGKSSLATSVCRKLNELSNKEISVVLPMDGYHYTRAQLKEMGSVPNGNTYSHTNIYT